MYLTALEGAVPPSTSSFPFLSVSCPFVTPTKVFLLCSFSQKQLKYKVSVFANRGIEGRRGHWVRLYCVYGEFICDLWLLYEASAPVQKLFIASGEYHCLT